MPHLHHLPLLCGCARSSFIIKDARLVAHDTAEVVLGTPFAGTPKHWTVTVCPPSGGASACKRLECPRSLCGTFTGLAASQRYTVSATATMPDGAVVNAANRMTLSLPPPTAPTLLTALIAGPDQAQADALPPATGTPCTSVCALPWLGRRSARLLLRLPSPSAYDGWHACWCAPDVHLVAPALRC